MSPLNRRDFLKRGSVAVAAAGVASTVPAVLPSLAGAAKPTAARAHPGGPEEAEDVGGPLDQPLVAHVRNLDTGEIGLFYGDREITYRDRRLAARLHRAAR